MCSLHSSMYLLTVTASAVQERQLLPALWRLEMPLVRVLADMESLGVAVNMQHLDNQMVRSL